jgi:hypothetical protein
MTTDDKIKRLKELNQLEEELKVKRDFKGLIDIYDESMKLFDSIGNHTERIPQKAYCLARLGLKAEAEKTLEGLRNVSFFADQDELFRAITLVSFFLTTPASELNLMQLNTIKNWLKDPKASKQVLQVVFDYADLVGNVKPFDNSRLQTKQTYFSDELLECVFVAMGRNDDTKIYYNRETNDVQQEVEGYLTSHMTSDQSAENRRLANRIMNSDSTDPIIDGLHFLIPRLPLSTFLEKFTEYAEDNDDLIDFIDEFESTIMEEYGDYVDSIEDLVFSESVSKSFFTELDKWYRNNDIDIDELKDIINRTRNSISREFLIEVNEE